MHILEHEQKAGPQQRAQSTMQTLCSEGGTRTMGEEEWIHTLHSFLERGFFEGRKTTESQPTAPVLESQGKAA